MKRFRGLVVLVAMLSLLAGCSGGAAKDTPATPAPQQPAAQTEPPTPVEPAKPENPNLILATTTSTQDSGLLDVLVPMFQEKTGYVVKTVAVGTGQALKLGENGEADVLLVHAPASEKPLVESGVAINRTLVMHNDYIVIGPTADPAGVKSTKTAAEGLKKIADAGAVFISRGDDSGTHKKELSLWKEAGIEPAGQWYQETGSGMGATITVANEKAGYTITDRATYLAQKKNIQLEIVLEGDAPLLNIYHVMQVNPEKFNMVNADGAQAFAEFLLSQEGQETIKNFGIDEYGEPLFFPDGGKVEGDLTGGK